MDNISRKTVVLAILLASSCLIFPEIASAQTGQTGTTPAGCETITDENRAVCQDPDEGSDRDQGEMSSGAQTGGGIATGTGDSAGGTESDAGGGAQGGTGGGTGGAGNN